MKNKEVWNYLILSHGKKSKMFLSYMKKENLSSTSRRQVCRLSDVMSSSPSIVWVPALFIRSIVNVYFSNSLEKNQNPRFLQKPKLVVFLFFFFFNYTAKLRSKTKEHRVKL